MGAVAVGIAAWHLHANDNEHLTREQQRAQRRRNEALARADIVMNRNHLDAFEGRNVVYCHQCENEWYEDDSGLECPRCQSGATEIVTAENDPRNMMERSEPLRHDDPDEDDIDEFMRAAPNGASYFSRTYGSPGPFDRPDDPRRPVDPNNGGDIIGRFTEMLMHDLGAAGGRHQVGRSGPDTLFGPPFPAGHGDGDAFVRRSNMTFSRTFTRNPDGSTSYIIASGPMHGGGGAGEPGGPPMGFDHTFEQLLTGLRPPTHGMPPQHRHGGLPETLSNLLASVLRPNGVHGDAVFSQQALDRVISDLMEANPQSNAAPPASQSAIDKLEKKKADEKMLDADGTGVAKGECTICISDVNVGDEVVLLPCKHWFHEDCVTMWLKEHNTCPVCRTAIEENNNARGNNAGSRGGSQPGSPSDPNGPGGNSNGGAPTGINPWGGPANVNPGFLPRGNSNDSGNGGASTGFNPWGGPAQLNPGFVHNRSRPFDARNPFNNVSGGMYTYRTPNRNPHDNPFNSFMNPRSTPAQPRSPQGGYNAQDRNAERLARIERLRNPDRQPSGEELSQRRSRSPRATSREAEQNNSRPWRSNLSLRGDRRSSSGRSGEEQQQQQQQGQAQGQTSSPRGFLGRIGNSLPWSSSSRHGGQDRERRS